MMFEVQTKTLVDGWVNTWSDGNGKPERFVTRAEAETALELFFDDVRRAVKDGDMAEEYSPDDYRIVDV